jgi:hypothetical protein
MSEYNHRSRFSGILRIRREIPGLDLSGANLEPELFQAEDISVPPWRRRDLGAGKQHGSLCKEKQAAVYHVYNENP